MLRITSTEEQLPDVFTNTLIMFSGLFPRGQSPLNEITHGNIGCRCSKIFVSAGEAKGVHILHLNKSAAHADDGPGRRASITACDGWPRSVASEYAMRRLSRWRRLLPAAHPQTGH